MISVAYGVFYVAFTFGIGLMMHENRLPLTPVQSPESPCNNTEDDGGYNAFGSWFASKDTTEKNDGVFKTSFWIMFSPGEPDLLGDAAADADNTSLKLRRWFGLTLWAIFQVIITIVLVNLCIGLLNNTISIINKEKEKVWKSARTKVWLRFILDRGLPPPLNFLSLLASLFKRIIRLLTCKKEEERDSAIEMQNINQQDDEPQPCEVEYINLVSKLTKRYLRHAEDSRDNAANKEHLEKFKREVVSNLKKGHRNRTIR